MEGRRKRVKKAEVVLPSALKTREREFNIVEAFLKEKMRTKSSGCLFISGTPGLGKTATVKRVIDRLNMDDNRFQYIELNGLFLSAPSTAYSKILQQMTGKIATPRQALNSLKEIFESRSPQDSPLILFIDEFDYVYKNSPNVVLEIVKLHLRQNSQLSIITIGNRKIRVSDLETALHRDNIKINTLMFREYSNADLAIIVADQLKRAFDTKVIEFIVKKYAAKRKDVRLILYICATILNKLSNDNEEITLEIAKKICEEMFSNQAVEAIRSLSPFGKVLLRVICDECRNAGSSLDEKIHFLCKNVCAIEGVRCPNSSGLCYMVADLVEMGFLTTDDSRINIHSKIRLNILPDLINNALHMKD